MMMMTFIDRQADKESLRDYQRDKWGAMDGETCVIDLSGLAAPNAKKAKDTGLFLQERIRQICGRIRDHQPRLVVMYGREQNDYWNAIGRAITVRDFPPDDSAPGKLPKTNVLRHGPTILVCTPHPSRPIKDGTTYLGNAYWTRLGKILRDFAPGPVAA